MLRDYPSLLLGHYNFWCHPALDGTCIPGEWHSAGGDGVEWDGAGRCCGVMGWRGGEEASGTVEAGGTVRGAVLGEVQRGTASESGWSGAAA